jgi:chemosensory pili system protein ChpA (sensor histidine kinase/response regulator)
MQELVSESLQIVGEELTVTLNDVRAALEQYADGGATQKSIEKCVQLLHAANGALRVTETYGASLLAEEMEGTCEHLSKLRPDDSRTEEVLEALSRAAVQLPAYVDIIINGGRDIPLVLLPLLNDLRAARGRPLLSESTLLLLNFGSADAQEPEIESRGGSGENVEELAKQLRPGFQLALLGWIRGDDQQGNLKKIGDCAERLKKAASAREVHQLWWVVGGVVEALLDGGLENSVSVKRLMGQADREMKRLFTIGEESYKDKPPTELVNNLLYYIARAPAAGVRVGAIRAAFNLSELMPGDDQVEEARESLAAPSQRLMTTVAEAIRDDLARVKDVLDIYVRTGMQHAEELVPQIELLKKIGDTLGVLGLGDLRETIQLKRGELKDIIDSGQQVEESVLLDMASALLYVEDHLDERLFGLIRPPDAGDDDEEPTDTEFDQVREAVMRECGVNLSRVKDAVAMVLERPNEAALLDAVPVHLRGITAGLMILEKDDAVSVVEDIGEVIGDLIQSGYTSVDQHQLDLLADAIVSLEYYMETLQNGRKEPIYMLDNARECLRALKEAEPSAVPQIGGERETSGLTTTMQVPDYTSTQLVAATQVIPSMAETPAGGEQRIDPELIELFIEEAGEEIESIRKAFPLWEQDDGRSDMLAQIRRSFHTLKGSGRMVGAELIGEFSWRVEDLLNRLINGTLERQPEIVDCVRRATEALPELLEQLEAGAELTSDIDSVMQDAHTLAHGEPAAAEADDGEAEAGSDTAIVSPEEMGELGLEAAEPEPIDPALMEILSKETGTHLEVILRFVGDAAETVSPYQVDEELHRACHTLHGSVTMANAAAASAVTGPLNQMIRRAYDHDVPVDESAIVACADAVEAIAEIVSCLGGGGGDELPDTEELQARLEQIDATIEEAAALAEAHAQADESIPPGVIEVDAGAVEELEVEEELIAEDELIAEESEAPAELAGDDQAEEAEPALDMALDPAIDPEIVEIFSEEATEILDAIEAALASSSDKQLDDGSLSELQRHLHTLKGGARLAGLMAMGDLSHDLETLLVRFAGGAVEQSPERFDVVRETVDELHRLRDQAVDGQMPVPQQALFDSIAVALGEEPALTEEPSAAEVAEEPEPEPELDTEPEEIVAAEEPEPVEEPAEAEPEAEPEAEDVPAPSIPASEQLGELARELELPPVPETRDLSDLMPRAPAEPAVRERRELARVDPGLLENLLNAAGEVSIFHSRLTQQMGQIQFNLEELGQTVIRLREQLRSLEVATEAQIIYQHQTEQRFDEEVDPLTLERYSTIQQLSRALAETSSDVGSLKDMLQNLVGDTEALLAQQARTAAELQDGLMRTRMVGFHQQGTRLERLARQTGNEHGKRAELVVHGGGEIDRQVLEKMMPPLEHMVRNAVIHGIETPEEREAAGKPPVGNVTITLRREGAQVVIELVDDGRGMDSDSILRKAIDLGMADGAETLSPDEILQFVLRPGFSTADELTHAAGRGVGMDVVASEIAKLGGTLHIDTQPGKGTAFSIRLPFTLAVTQALIVRVAQELFALPLQTVEGIIRIPRAEFEAKLTDPDPHIDYAGREYQFRHLGQYLGLGPARITEEQDRVSLVLVQAGSHSTALVADEMLDSREIVVKPVGGQFSAIRGISGATILGDGRIVVILDVASLVRMTPKPITPEDIAAEPEPVEPLALVVDDSITMRRVTQRLLERHGMRVVTAKDGVEAISTLREHMPDIILLDVEMPRMDGYEFAAHVRNDADTADLPIIMITSRVSDKHKARAIELGVNDYLGKPYQEAKLLDAVNSLLDRDEAE